MLNLKITLIKCWWAKLKLERQLLINFSFLLEERLIKLKTVQTSHQATLMSTIYLVIWRLRTRMFLTSILSSPATKIWLKVNSAMKKSSKSIATVLRNFYRKRLIWTRILKQWSSATTSVKALMLMNSKRSYSKIK